ncbi:long-chain fatty acid transport protein 1-like [Tropilaelaps mercedesae]|uniref:Very long-chain fatty acid transport protein n=1 Tax=Tropilaelaps mercedesae TaxID=418985 RepID=A0A1V9XF34_9ACAR|nr:long-chain fatty acid transport protein 1-like [Tropilaelaps mercedesae]
MTPDRTTPGAYPALADSGPVIPGEGNAARGQANVCWRLRPCDRPAAQDKRPLSARASLRACSKRGDREEQFAVRGQSAVVKRDAEIVCQSQLLRNCTLRNGLVTRRVKSLLHHGPGQLRRKLTKWAFRKHDMAIPPDLDVPKGSARALSGVPQGYTSVIAGVTPFAETKGSNLSLFEEGGKYNDKIVAPAPQSLNDNSSISTSGSQSRSLIGFLTLSIVGILHSMSLGLLMSFIVYVVLGGHKKLWILIQTAKRDLSAAVRFAKLNWTISGLWGIIRTNQTVPMIFKRTCNRHPDKVMLVGAERNWTFRQVDEFSNKVAMTFLNLGFRAGDDVALFMENRPEYLMIWLGLSKIGVVTALVNYNLKSAPLAHCVNVVDAKAVIFSSSLAKNVIDVYPDLHAESGNVQLFVYGETDAFGSTPVQQLKPLIESAPNKAPSFRGHITDKLVYIYTSGTTGLPKAAIIKHMRFVFMTVGIKHMMPLMEDDVMYLCLPLYHAAGGILGAGQTIVTGVTGVVVPKFSASKYWIDCAKYNCTVSQYIGEICRYLLAQPERKTDKAHKVRMMFGNGLRAQIWEEFRDRFGIADIRELYGSTEGNSNLINIDNKVGAVGFLPSISKIIPSVSERIYPVRLIRINENTGLPLRDRHGLCIQAEPGETGEMVGLIQNSSIHKFDGYVDKSATSKKLYRDVFHKGDIAFSSGDLLMQDELGYLYFKDRTGDTFRWKGENVSTSEVEGILTKVVGLSDVIVYGVEVTGCEGKAGMAAILDPDRKVDLERMLSESTAILPSYAVPIFVRLLSEVDATGTYKLKKIDLVKEAYEVSRIKDPVYILDVAEKKYVPLTEQIYSKIQNKQMHV